jgi:hypothetical protein
MKLTRRSLLKWLTLTIVANVLGAGIGAVYALTLGADSANAGAPRAWTLSPSELPEEKEPTVPDDTVPPTTPVPEKPADGAFTSTRPRFTWKASEDASPIMYWIDFSSDPNFTPGTVTTVYNIYTNSWQTPPDAAFPLLVKVYWRVTVVDSHGNESPHSPTASFIPTPLDGGASVEAGPASVELDPLG